MELRIFAPAYNVAGSLVKLIEELDDVQDTLTRQGHNLSVLIINDNSTDDTREALEHASQRYDWLFVRHNEQNLGNAGNIIAGYQWGVDSDADIIGCLDADGEHSPYAMIRHLGMIEDGKCDGIAGTIIFPEHDVVNHLDRKMMWFWGESQSKAAGIDGVFYIQSPGYNLHQRHRVAKALELFKDYQQFFTQNSSEQLPRWGMHGVFIHLIAVGTGADRGAFRRQQRGV